MRYVWSFLLVAALGACAQGGTGVANRSMIEINGDYNAVTVTVHSEGDGTGGAGGDPSTTLKIPVGGL